MNKSILMAAVMIATSHLLGFAQEGMASDSVTPPPFLQAPSEAYAPPLSLQTSSSSLKSQLSTMGFSPEKETRPEFALAVIPSRLGKLGEVAPLPGKEASWVIRTKSPSPESTVSLEIIPSRVPLEVIIPMWEMLAKQDFPSAGEWKTKTENASGHVPGKLLAMRQSGSNLLILARFAEGPDGVYILSCRLFTEGMSKENISVWVEALHRCALIPWGDAKKAMISGVPQRG